MSLEDVQRRGKMALSWMKVKFFGGQDCLLYVDQTVLVRNFSLPPLTFILCNCDLNQVLSPHNSLPDFIPRLCDPIPRIYDFAKDIISVFIFIINNLQ